MMHKYLYVLAFYHALPLNLHTYINLFTEIKLTVLYNLGLKIFIDPKIMNHCPQIPASLKARNCES